MSYISRVLYFKEKIYFIFLNFFFQVYEMFAVFIFVMINIDYVKLHVLCTFIVYFTACMSGNF